MPSASRGLERRGPEKEKAPDFSGAFVVELDGIEPTTSSLQSSRQPDHGPPQASTPHPAVTMTVGGCPPQSRESTGLHGRVDTKWTPPEGALNEGRYRTVHDARPHMQMLKVKEAAARLGVSTAAVYAWVDNGSLAHVRLFDHAIRINESDLAAFVGDRRRGRGT